MSSNATAPATTDPTAAPALPALDDTLGAIFIGTWLSLILYGIAIHQAYHYYANYKHDKLWLKVFVACVLVSETVCAALTMHSCYFYAVTNYFVPASLDVVTWSASTLSIFGALTVVFTQTFFVHRVWLINKKWRPLVAVAVLLMILELVVCFIAGQKGFELKSWTLWTNFTWLIAIHAGASTISDLLITSVLIHTLRNSRTGVKRTDSMIGTLILYAISTGLLTGLYNGICFLTALILPHELVYLGTVIVGIRLYSNSLFAALNSRRSISDRHAGEIAMSDTTPFGISGRRSGPFGGKTLDTSLNTYAPRSFQSATSATMSGGDVVDIKVTTEYARDTSSVEYGTAKRLDV